ncbi:MAG: OmpA family protein [Bacteroidetes bacterium]|nr:OmpA family protein [Bacteroidota bacterium]
MNLRTFIVKAFCFVILWCSFICNSTIAQNLTYTGYTKFEEEALPDVKVKAMVGAKVFAETTSGKNGFFSLKLDYNLNYSIYFEKENYAVMHADINGTIPEDKTNYKIKYEITIPFYHIRNQTINQKTFEKPFSKIYFDGKSKFVDNTEYIKDFLVQLKNIPETKSFVTPTIVAEKKHHIAGKVVCDNESKTPFNLAKVVLLDTNNKEISTTLTNRFGVFSFSNVGIKSTSKVMVYPADNSLMCKVLMYNINREKVAFLNNIEKQNLQFLNNDESKLIEHLIDDTYIPFLAGKIMVEEKGENVLLADKNVYLLSDKNEIIETTQTNMFGNFLFSKLPPDKNFIIAIDEAESGLNDNSHLHLYSYKDVEINKKDTLQKGKFLFKFLSNEVKSYNELLIEDINIKMDLKGKMVGDNENNPLRNLKILLLDNNYKVVDTATTNSKGDFTFRYLPYSKNLVLRFADTTDMINYSSIIIYDPNGKVVKYLSVKRGQRFDYKLLPGDLNKMNDLYIDDPWLNLASKDPKKPTTNNLVIIENIYFEFNQAMLLPAAKQTLDKAILALKNNPTMKIEISAHSDSKGSDDYNLKLSEKRAQAALEYITSKNIESKRISARGYGETKLLNKCGNKVECTEEEHAKNRRLEFNIIVK